MLYYRVNLVKRMLTYCLSQLYRITCTKNNMKNLKTGDDVIYTGETNSWTYHQDIEQNSQGWLENVIILNNEVSYRINFDNGVIATIDSWDLISK